MTAHEIKRAELMAQSALSVLAKEIQVRLELNDPPGIGFGRQLNGQWSISTRLLDRFCRVTRATPEGLLAALFAELKSPSRL